MSSSSKGPPRVHDLAKLSQFHQLTLSPIHPAAIPNPSPKYRKRTKSSSIHEISASSLFTPASTPNVLPKDSNLTRKSRSSSSPLLPTHRRTPSSSSSSKPLSAFSSRDYLPQMELDSDLDDDKDNMIYTAWRPGFSHAAANTSIRPRIFRPPIANALLSASGSGLSSRNRTHDKLICTKPGVEGAGETETEADEPVRIRIHSLAPCIFK